MIPMWMILKMPRHDGNPFTMHFPLIIAWALLSALFILLLPVWLVASLGLYAAGWGWSGFAVPALLIETFWQLHGLKIDVESKKEHIYIHFI